MSAATIKELAPDLAAEIEAASHEKSLWIAYHAARLAISHGAHGSDTGLERTLLALVRMHLLGWLTGWALRDVANETGSLKEGWTWGRGAVLAAFRLATHPKETDARLSAVDNMLRARAECVNPDHSCQSENAVDMVRRIVEAAK